VAGRRCTVCSHPDRPAIDQALVNRRPFRNIAQQVGVSVWALLRHHDAHLPEMLLKARAAEEVARADDLLEQVRALRSKSLALLGKAEAAGDLRTALAGVREARACVELLAEMVQALDRRPTMNVLLAPEWLSVRTVLLEALRGYPEARTAVVTRLAVLEASA
jgi:hypothetical protein